MRMCALLRADKSQSGRRRAPNSWSGWAGSSRKSRRRADHCDRRLKPSRFSAVKLANDKVTVTRWAVTESRNYRLYAVMESTRWRKRSIDDAFLRCWNKANAKLADLRTGRLRSCSGKLDVR